MQFTKKISIFIFSLFATLFSFSFVLGIDIFNLNEKDNFQEFSEIESKKVISYLPEITNKEWTSLMAEGKNPEELTALSLLNRASIFNVWNYVLADLPAETIVNGFKLFKEYKEEDDLLKVILEKTEKFSINESIKYINQELFNQNAKVSFGAIRGGVSGNNKEIIFQYVIVYIPIDNQNGKIIVRIYSPEEILPPESKGSYGASLSFLNSLNQGEKLKPFILEIKGKTKANIFNKYAWNLDIQPEITFISSKEIPDFNLSPTSWTQKYFIDEIKKVIENIPIIGTYLADREEIQFLNGKEDKEQINKEIESIISEKEISNRGIKENSDKVENASKDKANTKNDSSSKVKVSSKKTKVKKSTIASKGKITETLSQEETISNLTNEEKKQYIIKILQELIKRKQEDEQKEVIRLAELEKQKQKENEEETIKKLAIICSKSEAEVPKRNSVIFNEIAWMGSKDNPSAEWIELKNINGNEVNIQGWRIYDDENKISIKIKDKILINSKSYLLLERGESAVPNKEADIIYSGTLSNTKESLYLFDNDCELQDIVLANPNWPAGKNEEKRTMERSADFSWHTYSGTGNSNIFGTPREENSFYDYVPIISSSGSNNGSNNSNGGSSDTSNNNQSNNNNDSNTEVTYCNQNSTNVKKLSPVIINEIAWMGTIFSSTDEWIELKNITNEEINLNNYQLLDKDNNIKIVFGTNDKIEASSFYLLERTDDNSVPNILANKIYSGALSDSNESLRLFNNNCELVDEIESNPSWPAGDSIEKKAMERNKDLAGWHSYGNTFADSVSGLWGSPKNQNSGYIENEDDDNEDSEQEDNDDNEGNEEDSNEEETSSEELPENNFTEKSIKNIETSLGENSNQIILEWDKLDQSIEYEIYYSLENEIDKNNLIKIDAYTIPEITINDNKIKAIISDLYWGKKYYFAIKGKNEIGELSLLSKEININTLESVPKLAFKKGDYTNRNKYIFSGPASETWSQANSLIQQEGVSYFDSAVIDANNNIYVQGREGTDYNIIAYNSSQQKKWQFPGYGKNIFLGKDGTIYQITETNFLAISPSGKLKWKESFNFTFSKDGLIDGDGNIFLLVSNNGEMKPDLVVLKDKTTYAEKEILESSIDLIGENTCGYASEIVLDSNGNIYFGIDSKLIKYKYGEGLIDIRNFETEYIDYEWDKVYTPVIKRILLGEDNKIYLNIDDMLVTDEKHYSKIVAINSTDFQGEILWDHLSRGYVSLYTIGADSDSIYIEERSDMIMTTISSLSSIDGELKWKKKWLDNAIRNIIFIDDSGIIYVENGQNISAFNPNNINNESGNDDIIHEIVINETVNKSNISVLEDRIVIVFRDKILQINK